MNDAIKGAATSKTMWFAFVLAILGAVEQYQGLFVALIGADNMGKVLLGVAAVSAVLRVFTSAPLAEKGK